MEPAANGGAVAIGFICGMVIGIAIASLVGALILKLAVGIFNRLRGSSGTQYPTISRARGVGGTQSVAGAPATRDSENPYSAPHSLARPVAAPPAETPLSSQRGVPMPSYARAFGCTLLRVALDRVLSFGAFFLFGTNAPPPPADMADGALTPDAILQIVLESIWADIAITATTTCISFVIGTMVLRELLPTSFGKAAVIQLMEYAMGLALVVFLFVLVLAAVAGLQ